MPTSKSNNGRKKPARKTAPPAAAGAPKQLNPADHFTPEQLAIMRAEMRQAVVDAAPLLAEYMSDTISDGLLHQRNSATAAQDAQRRQAKKSLRQQGAQ